MPAHLIDGKAIAQQVTDKVRTDVAAYVATEGLAPGLAVVLVGDSAASQVYVRNKRRTTETVGMGSGQPEPCLRCRVVGKWIVSHFDANNMVGHELREVLPGDGAIRPQHKHVTVELGVQHRRSPSVSFFQTDGPPISA